MAYTVTDFKYKYPDGLDLSPDSEAHKTIVSFITERIRDSHGVMSARYDTWRDIDRVMSVFVQPTLNETARVNEEERLTSAKARIPKAIVIPISFAIKEILMTYSTVTILDEPIFRYRATDKGDVFGALAHEAIAQYQSSKRKMPLMLHNVLGDSYQYGTGFCGVDWDIEYAWKTIPEVSRVKKALSGLFGDETARERVKHYEGNNLTSFDPYKVYPDPNVPIEQIQKGEFFAWLEETNYYDLLSREQSQPDDERYFFNAKYMNLQGTAGLSSMLGYDKSARGERFNIAARSGGSYTRPVDVIWIVAKLIPKELSLGRNEYPEKWLFGLAADTTIVHARKLPYDHDMIPVGVCAPFADGHSVCPVSPVEVSYGQQKAVDFSWNNRQDFLTLAAKLRMIVDPYLINIPDLEDPERQFVRMRKSGWGLGKITESYSQLAFNDVTANNINDIAFLRDLMQYSTGALDSVAGVISSKKERVSAAETRNAAQAGASRLGHLIWVAGWQLITDVGYMIAYNNKQFLTEERTVRLIGDYMKSVAEDLSDPRIQEDFMQVSPLDLDVDLDIMAQPAQLPGAVDTNVLTDLYKTVVSNPQEAAKYNTSKLLRFIFRQLGVRNIENFEIKVAPDQQVMQQMRAGNLIPAEVSDNGIAASSVQ